MASCFILLLAACPGAPASRRTPQCNADAKIVLGGQDDVDAASGCLTIESLAIRTGAALDLSPLRKLHVVLGELRVGPSVGLEELKLPELHSAGSIAIAGNGNLQGVFFPKLVTANSIAIDGHVELATVAMPKLSKVRGDLAIVSNTALGLVDLESLAIVEGELHVSGNPQLTLLELGKLERAKTLRIENNKALPSDIVDAIRKVAP